MRRVRTLSVPLHQDARQQLPYHRLHPPAQPVRALRQTRAPCARTSRPRTRCATTALPTRRSRQQRPETGARNNTTTASIAQAQTPTAQLEQAAEHPLETDHSAAHLSPPPPELVDRQEVLAPNPNTGESKRQRKQTQQLNIRAKGKTYVPVHDLTEQFPAPLKLGKRESKQRFGALVIARFAAAQDVQEQHTPTNAPVLYETQLNSAAARSAVASATSATTQTNAVRLLQNTI